MKRYFIGSMIIIMLLILVGCNNVENVNNKNDISQNGEELEEIIKDFQDDNYYSIISSLADPYYTGDKAKHMLAIITDGFYDKREKNISEYGIVFKLDVINQIAKEMYSDENVEIINNYINNQMSDEIVTSSDELVQSEKFIIIDKEKGLIQVLNLDSAFASRNTIKDKIKKIECKEGKYFVTVNEWIDIQGEGWEKNEVEDRKTGNIVTLLY